MVPTPRPRLVSHQFQLSRELILDGWEVPRTPPWLCSKTRCDKMDGPVVMPQVVTIGWSC